MPTRHIYFNDELYELLKSEDNASELIQKLLKDYYDSLNEKTQKPKPLLDILEDSAAKTAAQLQTNHLREVILKEMEEQENELKRLT